jgi:hypothetical protein
MPEMTGAVLVGAEIVTDVVPLLRPALRLPDPAIANCPLIARTKLAAAVNIACRQFELVNSRSRVVRKTPDGWRG